jgi:hypothetical protein
MLSAKDGAAKNAPGKLRVWDKDYCPRCAGPKFEFISRSKFEKRAKQEGDPIKRETLRKYVGAGTYCADARGRLPWCPVCKAKTPSGTGERVPECREKYKASDEQAKLYGTWCAHEAAAALGLRLQLSLSAPPDGEKNPQVARAREVGRSAFVAVLKAHEEQKRDLNRDEVITIAKQVIKACREDDTLDAAAVGDDEDIQSAVSKSKAHRPEGQRLGQLDRDRPRRD